MSKPFCKTLFVVLFSQYVDVFGNKETVQNVTKQAGLNDIDTEDVEGNTIKLPLFLQNKTVSDTQTKQSVNDPENGKDEEKIPWPRARKYDDGRGFTRVLNISLLQNDGSSSDPTLKTSVTPAFVGADEMAEIDVVNPYAQYPDLNPYDIKNQLTTLFRKFSHANVTTEVIGRTVEYNDIVLLKITENAGEHTYWRTNQDKYDTDTKQKKIIFIVHGLSTRDIRLMPCLYIEKDFRELASYYLKHLSDFDIFMIPLANPDGYAKNVLFWNKNVSPQSDCGGVALDSNFDVGWNKSSTISSCSQFYPGPEPFSEKESKAIEDVLHKYSTKIVAYINVQVTNNNFDVRGDTVLYPKGYTDKQSDEDKYIDLKGEIDEAMTNASFEQIKVHVDTMYNWYGKISGRSVDYAAKVYGIPFAMEFLMNPHKTIFGNADYVETHEHAALEQIWQRVIDTVFAFILKSMKPAEVE